MNSPSLLSSALIGAVASVRSMTWMAALAAARIAGRSTPGEFALLDRPLVKYGALAMGVGELFGDKMTTAPDRTVFLGLLARVMGAGIAGAALAPRGRERAGAAVAVATARGPRRLCPARRAGWLERARDQPPERTQGLRTHRDRGRTVCRTAATPEQVFKDLYFLMPHTAASNRFLRCRVDFLNGSDPCHLLHQTV